MKTIHAGDLRPWEKVGEPKVLAQTRFLRAYEQGFRHPGTQETHQFSMSDLGDAALVLPLTPRNSIILVKQFMQASEVVTIEIPGGRVESSQSPQECAASELLEETGHVARELVLLGEMRASTRQSRNKHYLYLGLDCHQNGLQRLDALEAIEVVEVDVAEFFQLLAEGKICDSATLAATALAISKGYLDPPS